MAPPTPLIAFEEAGKKFQELSPTDCKLREIIQYQCAANKEGQVVCVPFTRLFRNCLISKFDKRSNQVYSRRQSLEITKPTDNSILGGLSDNESVDFINDCSGMHDALGT